MTLKNSEETLYIPLSKVVKLLKIKPYILYYWEKRIPQLKPYRISNRKFYKKEQLKLLFEVKTLLEKGYTLEGVKKLLQQKDTKKDLLTSSIEPSSREKLLERILKEVLEELKNIYQTL